MKSENNLTLLKIKLNGQAIFVMANRVMTGEEVGIFREQLLCSEQEQSAIVSRRAEFPLWDFDDNDQTLDRAAMKMNPYGITFQRIPEPVNLDLDADR